MHAARTTLMLLIANIRAALGHVRKLRSSRRRRRWKTLLDYIVARIIPLSRNCANRCAKNVSARAIKTSPPSLSAL
jgi:2-iminoacetate synthase ThiH